MFNSKRSTEVFRFKFVPEDIRKNHPENYYISYRRPGDSWSKIEAEAECRGLINRITIGDADCMAFKAKTVVDIYSEALRSDPYAFFEINR